MKLDFREFDKAYNEDVDKRIKEKSEKKARIKKRQNARQIYVYIAVVVLAFIVGINIVSGYVELNNYKFENSKLQKDVDSLVDDINELRLQIEQKQDSAFLKDFATKQLGMVMPGYSQKRVLSGAQSYTLNPSTKNVIVLTDDKATAAQNAGVQKNN